MTCPQDKRDLVTQTRALVRAGWPLSKTTFFQDSVEAVCLQSVCSDLATHCHGFGTLFCASTSQRGWGSYLAMSGDIMAVASRCPVGGGQGTAACPQCPGRPHHKTGCPASVVGGGKPWCMRSLPPSLHKAVGHRPKVTSLCPAVVSTPRLGWGTCGNRAPLPALSPPPGSDPPGLGPESAFLQVPR